MSGQHNLDHTQDHPTQERLKPLNDAFKNILCCPETGAVLREEAGFLVSDRGKKYPIIRGIPRFVPDDQYVGSFSFEWNTHNRTQLDSFTGSSSSEIMLTQKTGLRPEDVAGKRVLDAGIGAGRFSDVLVKWGANVVGVDLSFAVEASHVSFLEKSNILVAQADIGNLPFADETFDIIMSIGVLHHTPSTEKYFKALVPKLKRGGRISIWVYPNEGDYKIRNYWIPFTSKIPPKAFYDWCRWFVPMAHRNKDNPLIGFAKRMFPFSDQGLGLENDILDTFDGYSPTFHGIHSNAEVIGWFEDVGLTSVTALPITTSVTGIKP